MSIPTSEQLVIASWTGNFDPADHQILYDSYGSGHLVALHVLRSRLNEILCGPARAEVDGDYEEDWEASIRSLERQIQRLESICLGLGLDIDGSGIGNMTANTLTKGGVRVRSYVKLDGTRVR